MKVGLCIWSLSRNHLRIWQKSNIFNFYYALQTLFLPFSSAITSTILSLVHAREFLVPAKVILILAFALSFQGIDDEDDEDDEDIRDTGLAAKSKKCGLRSSFHLQ